MTPETLTYAPLLEHMIDLLAANERLTFGEALKMVMAKYAIVNIPPHIEQALLLASYRVITTRGIPGAADA